MKRSAAVGFLPLAAIILAAFLPLLNAEACTRMFWNTNGKVMVTGRNMDLDIDDQPVFYVFPRGINKNGGADINPATWTSQYGSLVVTHLGHSTFSTEGMNTAGLAFHCLYLSPTIYEGRDATRPGVLQGRYGMYLLDNAATVSDALLLMYHTQLVPEVINGRIWPLHFALEDASGDSAIIEFIGGKMHVYHSSDYTVLTNDPPFDQHIQNLWEYQYFGGDLPMPGDLNPTDRFIRASAYLSSLSAGFSNQALKPDPVSAMFTAIRAITEPFGGIQFFSGVPVAAWPTLWTMVSDLTHKRVYFAHNLARNNFWINMSKLNFEPGAPILSLDAKKRGLHGEVSRLFTP